MQEFFFKKTPLFSAATPDTLRTLSQLAKRHSYKKGCLILNNKQASHTFLYVINGFLKIFKESTNGEEVIVDILSKDHHCGEYFIFQPNQDEAYHAQAITDVEIFTLQISPLRKLITGDHQLTLQFLQYTLQKQQDLNMEVEHLTIQSAIQRIGCFILRISELSHGQNVKLHLPYDKVLLASRLGMRAETFSRALAKLCAQCDITIEGDILHIGDIHTLACNICLHCSKIFPCQARD